MMPSIEIHLLYASIVWVAAWLLTSLHRGSATIKYWIWVATTLNFILPLGALPDRLWPSRLSWFAARIPTRSLSFNARLLWIVWSAGAALMLIRLCIRIARAARTESSGTPSVTGLLRPQISLPQGIERLLTAGELDAVLVHERIHAKRRDNLIRLIYELSLCALWFHPLVWMMGRRLALYRELSCDEAVTHRGALVSALAKLAGPDPSVLLHATASSFIADRLAWLGETPRAQHAANAILAAIFAIVLFGAAVGPVAQSAAAYACALTHGTAR
jgi:Zn-dependent protease with chaperone function